MSKPKPWYRSATFWGAAFVLVGVVLHRLATGEPVADAEVLALVSDVLVAAGLGGVVAGRTRAKAPLVWRDRSGGPDLEQTPNPDNEARGPEVPPP